MAPSPLDAAAIGLIVVVILSLVADLPRESAVADQDRIPTSDHLGMIHMAILDGRSGGPLTIRPFMARMPSMKSKHAHFQEQFPQLAERAREILCASPACHDWDHTQRVLNLARHLARVEGADRIVVEFAAVLHDVGRPDELADQGRTCHAQRGAEIAERLLGEVGIADGAFKTAVSDCVRTHRYRRRHGGKPASVEAEVVFDADKLDSIGAVGIGRAFHFAGRIGARLHNTREAALNSESYSREDSAYREFLVKLQHIRDCMLTREGRRIATLRHEFMVQFFDRICREANGEDVEVEGGSNQ